MFKDSFLRQKMDAAKAELKNRLKVYRDLDNKRRELNDKLREVREEQKIVELEMADILKSPQLSQVGVLRFEDDNSVVKIQRPGTYSKPWSLSKRDLQNYIDHYFENAGEQANRKDCVDFIIRQKKLDLVEEVDFKFVRNFPNENIDNE